MTSVWISNFEIKFLKNSPRLKDSAQIFNSTDSQLEIKFNWTIRKLKFFSSKSRDEVQLLNWTNGEILLELCQINAPNIDCWTKKPQF